MAEAADERDDRIAEIIATHAARSGATLPILLAIQEAFGYVPRDAVAAVARALNLSRAEIQGVVSFYHDFRTEPPGRHVLKLCRAESCQAMGGDALAARALPRVEGSWGATSADGALTVEPVFCLGLCACSPAAMLDGEPLGRLAPAELDALLEALQ